MESILEKINKSTISILASQSIQEVCKIIVEEGKNLVNAEQGAIYLPKKKKLELAYTSDSLVIKIKQTKKGYIQQIINKGEIAILHTEDLKKIDPKFKFTKIKSLMVIPLLYHQKPIGVLILHSTNDEFITERDLEIIKLFRSVASIALEKTQLHLQTQNALDVRDRFISLASHELRTPLTSINGYIQLLYNKQNNKDSVEARWIKELYTESARLTYLIKELLDVNRIKQGQFQILFSEVDIRKIIKNTIENSHYESPEREIDFIDNNNLKNATVIGDKEKLTQMISSLLNNAKKFSKPTSKISITLQTEKNYILLRITNDGKYISKQELENILGGFYKEGNNDNRGGMGVGLLVSKHIIETHKGKLQINSKKKRGTTIEVKLPYAKLSES